MYVILAVIIGLIVGFIRKGSFKGFGAKKISLLPLGIIGLVLQIALHLYCYTGGIAGIDAFIPVVNFVSYILILITLVFNLDDFWTIMMAVGITADFIVSFINGGKMPVAANIAEVLPAGSALANTLTAGTNGVYAITQSSTVLWFLGINIHVPFVDNVSAIFGSVGSLSVGGIFVFVGLVGWVQYAMCRTKAEPVFGKETDFGDLDYIIPPDEGKAQEADEENLFNRGSVFDMDQENDFSEGIFIKAKGDTKPLSPVDQLFAEEDEDDLTRVVPKLTKEHIKEMQQKGEAPLAATEDFDETDSTRVFTAIGKIEEPQEEQEVVSDEDLEEDSSIAGFFTQSFYAEREKGKLAFDEPEEEKTEAVSLPSEAPELGRTERLGGIIHSALDTRDEPESVEEPILDKTVVFAEPVETFEELSAPQSVKTKKIVGFINPEEDSDMESRRSENEMLNIWQQAAQENERMRTKHRRKTKYTETSEPFKAEREKEVVVEVAPSVEEKEIVQPAPVKKEVLQEKRAEEKTSKTFEMPITKVIETEETFTEISTPEYLAKDQEATESNTTVFNTKQVESEIREQTKASTKQTHGKISDEDREKAGYERVQLNIDGKEVVFWRKKKD